MMGTTVIVLLICVSPIAIDDDVFQMMTNFIRPWPLGVEPSVAAGLLQDGQRQQRVRDRVQLQQQSKVDDKSQCLPG